MNCVFIFFAARYKNIAVTSTSNNLFIIGVCYPLFCTAAIFIPEFIFISAMRQFNFNTMYTRFLILCHFIVIGYCPIGYLQPAYIYVFCFAVFVAECYFVSVDFRANDFIGVFSLYHYNTVVTLYYVIIRITYPFIIYDKFILMFPRC